MKDAPKIHRGERSGGTIRTRGTHDGRRVDVYRACCDGCSELGPESPNSQRGARTLAIKKGWTCEKRRTARALLETHVWVVRCPACSTSSAPS